MRKDLAVMMRRRWEGKVGRLVKAQAAEADLAQRHGAIAEAYQRDIAHAKEQVGYWALRVKR